MRTAAQTVGTVLGDALITPNRLIVETIGGGSVPSHAELGHDGEVIGSDPGAPRAMNPESLALEVLVPVDPIEGQEREDRRVRAAHARLGRELVPQRPADRAAVPLVEIAHQHARPFHAHRDGEEVREQRKLLAPLAEAESEVAVEHVQPGAVDGQIHAEAAPRLVPAVTQVVRRRPDQRQPREDGVAERGAPVGPRHAHHRSHRELGGQVGGLIGVSGTFRPDHLLEPDHIRLDLLDHRGDPVRSASAQCAARLGSNKRRPRRSTSSSSRTRPLSLTRTHRPRRSN